MTVPKPMAGLSLDLDNKWTYLKTHGDPGWESYPSYLDVVVPRVLDFLDTRQLKITVFIVGQDAALPANRDALASIAAAGHEIGNHSFHHEPWLHLYSEDEIDADLRAAEVAINSVTGVHNPEPDSAAQSFQLLQETTLRVLARRGYRYDASTFPTFLGPLARAYYFMTARLSPDEKRQRSALFGALSEGFRPLKPYHWRTEQGLLTELPVTTMPLFRLPFHASYLLYLSTVSPRFALAYFVLALRLCRLTRTTPSFLLHPLDFLGRDDESELSFFPAMNLLSERKVAFLAEVIRILMKDYTVVPLETLAAANGEAGEAHPAPDALSATMAHVVKR